MKAAHIRQSFKASYLVQRLKKPFKQKQEEKSIMAHLANAFSFGGGLPNGGLTKEAMSMLNKIWRYDYMGSAEFEWGAVPESLSAMYELRKAKELIKGSVTVKAKYHHFSDRKTIAKEQEVFYVCVKYMENDVKHQIEVFADEIKHDFRTKERVSLASSICREDNNGDVVGWHDIDNHFVFFIDKEMYDGFCDLFKLK